MFEKEINRQPLYGGGGNMAKTVAIGIQDFEKIRSSNCFYVDKTGFIKDCRESTLNRSAIDSNKFIVPKIR